jgi:Chaperone of endosialidase
MLNMADGLGFQPRVKEPETSYPERQGSPLAALVGVGALSMPDTSGPGPTPLQEPAAWTYDFNPASGSSRAFFNGEVSANSISGGSAAGVTSWNGETGVVVMTLADITGAGGAPIASPIFTGNPAAPTRLAGDSSGGLATTAFVQQAIAANPTVASFNGRTGAVTLTTGDVTGAGGAPANNAALTGVPTAPTASPGSQTSQIASTAFVGAAIAGQTVTAFNGRQGAVSLTLSDVQSVGGAPIASPTFTGTPVVPTATPGTATGQAASTAFVTNAVAGSVVGVASFNTRTGAVVFTPADLASVGGAPLLSPTFTGTPHAPTPSAGDNSTALATTAFVDTAIASLPSGVSTFNGRSGTVVLTLPDVTSVGGAPVASPTFTGSPITTTPAPGDNSTRVASTAFVTAAIGALPAQPAPSGANPLINGTAAPGSSALYSRGDHVHPTDTTRAAQASLANYAPLAGAAFTGAVSTTGALSAANLTTSGGVTALNGNIISAIAGSPQFTLFTNATVGSLFWNTGASAVGLFNQASSGQALIDNGGNFSVTGAALKPGGGAWSATSDERIKTVIESYAPGLDELLTLNPVVYTFKGNDTPSADLGTDTPAGREPYSGAAPFPGSPHYRPAIEGTEFVGFIAQELELACPGMVTSGPGFIDGEPVEDLRQVNVSNLVYMLVNAVKTLSARIAVLEGA